MSAAVASARRVVVLGGTFDPVHHGHLAVIRGALDALDATDGVLLVDRGHRHRAAPIASHRDRQDLVRRATARDPQLHEAGELGLDGGLPEAVARLCSAGHEVHVVFGADSARHLDRWDGRRRLDGAQLWAVPRHGDAPDGIDGVGWLAIDAPAASSTQIRFAVAAGRRPPRAVPAPCRDAVAHLYSRSASCEGVAHHA